MRLLGLLEEGEYEIREQGMAELPYTCYGDELMNYGLILSDQASGVRTAGVRQGQISDLWDRKLPFTRITKALLTLL